MAEAQLRPQQQEAGRASPATPASAAPGVSAPRRWWGLAVRLAVLAAAGAIVLLFTTQWNR